MFTDPTGMSKEGPPKGNPGVLLTPVYRSTTIGNVKLQVISHYKFKPSVAYLLKLVSGVHLNAINKAKVMLSPGSGSSVTLGSNPMNAFIIHFSGEIATDPNNTIKFLQRNAHEVGHIPQLEKGNIEHIMTSINEYFQNIESGQHWHDGSFSSKEREADIGENNFVNFNNFVDKNYGEDELKNLFESKKDENEKIETIKVWWNEFQNQNH